MLLMKTECEACGCGLPADEDGAFICSFECSFCRDCAEGSLGRQCPNCEGILVERPIRSGEALRRAPAERAARA